MSNLRYNITDWHQLANVESNNSRDLYIKVGDIIQNDVLEGLRIQVMHKTFGALYVIVLNATGSLVTVPEESQPTEPTTADILAELAKWGFDVVFEEVKYLPPGQLDFLASLKGLCFDKIRILNVKGSTGVSSVPYLVVFNIIQNPKWLSNTYAATEKEFTDSLKNGSVINISATGKGKQWSWSWLDFVGDIQDILDQNHYGE